MSSLAYGGPGGDVLISSGHNSSGQLKLGGLPVSKAYVPPYSTTSGLIQFHKPGPVEVIAEGAPGPPKEFRFPSLKVLCEIEPTVIA